MANQFCSFVRFQPLIWISVFAVLSAAMLAVDVTVVEAFRPHGLFRRICVPSNFVPLSTTGGVPRSRYPLLKSTNRSNASNNVDRVQNNDHVGNDNDDITYNDGENGKSVKVDTLLELLESVPSNAPTPRPLTEKILKAVRKLEEDCPTPDESVLSELSGNWELIWTAQDRSSEQYLKLGLTNRFINPLENQSYSNNPFRRRDTGSGNDNDDGGAATGRANPVLPREIQDALERTGVLEASGGSRTAPIRSSQGIDTRRNRVRNVVSVQIKKPFPVKGSLIVDINFKPNAEDQRRVDVQFDSCRLIFQNAKLDQKFPLGVFGPTGWLRTGYIDDRIRITRGHKGSVFVLFRIAKRK